LTRLFPYISLCFCLFGLLSSCDQSTIYERKLKIESAAWDRDQLAKFNFKIEDTSANYSLFLNFRHGGNYPYRNIYLFSQFKSPGGQVAIDTAQMILADERGRWMGKGLGDLFSYRFRFKSGNIFPEKGEYELLLEQAMRDEILTDVTDIGIEVKKINSKQ